MTHPDGLIWRKASRSTGQNDCVEVARTPTALLIRDSKNPGGHQLAVTAQMWESLITRVKDGGLS